MLPVLKIHYYVKPKAWKNGRVIFVDADAWYTTAASPTSLKIVMEDVKKKAINKFLGNSLS